TRPRRRDDGGADDKGERESERADNGNVLQVLRRTRVSLVGAPRASLWRPVRRLWLRWAPSAGEAADENGDLRAAGNAGARTRLFVDDEPVLALGRRPAVEHDDEEPGRAQGAGRG